MQTDRQIVPSRIKSRLYSVPDSDAIPFTIRQIAKAIKAGAKYLPLLNYARALATTAPPKNYLKQLEAVYNDVLKNWRYVRDPFEVETVTVEPRALFNLVLGKNGGVGKGKGAGDCDDITAGIGAMLRAIGFPVRIVTSAPPGNPKQYTHVFIQALVPGRGWFTIDPVLHPKRGFGAMVPHSKLGYWDLNGNIAGIEKKKHLGGDEMTRYQDYTDQFLGGAEYIEDAGLPDEWLPQNPEWGSELGSCGYIGNANHLDIEVTERDRVGPDQYITPVLAMEPQDVQYIGMAGTPLVGMKAMGDNGYIYEWTNGSNDGRLSGPGLGGFFKKIFKKVKKGYKAVKSKVRSVMKKTAFGRFVLRVKDKIVSVTMKIVKPLAKFAGKWALKIAPVAALIPGVGTAIAAALVAVGTVAKLYNKYGAIVEKLTSEDESGNLVPVEKLKFPNSAAESAFKKAATSAAADLAKRGSKEIDAINADLRKRPLPSSVSPFQRAALQAQAAKASAARAVAEKAAAQARARSIGVARGRAIAMARARAAAAGRAKAASLAAAKAKAAAEAKAKAEAAAAIAKLRQQELKAAAQANVAAARAKGKAGAMRIAAKKRAALKKKMLKKRKEIVKRYRKKIKIARKDAVVRYKKRRASRPEKQQFKANVRALKKLGYKIKIREAA